MYLSTRESCVKTVLIKVSVESKGFLMPSPTDESIEGINFSRSGRLRFLPEFPAENFPNLTVYNAEHFDVEGVSRKNFMNLVKLRKLHLEHNRIKVLDNDTFEGLKALEEIHLSKYD